MRAFMLAVTGVVLAFTACSTYGTSVVDVRNQKAAIASIVVSLPRSLVAGQTGRAVATPKDANGNPLTDRAVAWSTSSAAIATVDNSGNISALAAGDAVVSAVSEGVTGSASLAVIPPTPTSVAAVTIAINPAAVVVGQTAHAAATMKDANGNVLSGRTVTWQSSDSRIATVQATGDLQAVAPGSSVITATSEGVSGSSTFTVSAPAAIPVASVAVSPATATIQVGGTAQLSAVTLDAGSNVLTGRVVVWNSSNPAVASVSSTGLVSAVAGGSAQISASSEGQSGSASISVTAPSPVPVATVTVVLATSSLLIGQATQATATPRDANNNVLTGRAIAWSSNNLSVASVSATGTVTAKAAGTAQISAVSEGQTGAATVTVTVPPPVPVSSIAISPASASILVGSTLQLAATTFDAMGNTLTGRTVTWSSSNTVVASVGSSSGLVTALTSGTVQITALSEGKTTLATITDTVASPPPPPPPSGSAEPAGMTKLSERPFDAVQEDGWSVWAGTGSTSNFTISSDATAPKSPSNVGQVRFPAGLIGGNEPVNVGKTLSGSPHTIYVSMWLKLSSNWVANSSGVSKSLHIFINGINRVYTSSQGTTTLVPELRLQQLAGNFDAMAQGGEGSGQYVNLTPNVAGQTGTQVFRGRWHKWEMVLYGGSAGGADGTVDWWIDGVKVGHYTGIPFVAAGGSNTWESVIWSPTWGGMGGAVPADQYQWMDHMYISGK